MSFKLPHENDFATDAKLPGYLTENALAIEQAINDLDKKIDNEVQDRESADTETNTNLNNLDQSKATHDDVKKLQDEMYQIRDNWHDRASHIALGTDAETTKAVVEQILQEKGLI